MCFVCEYRALAYIVCLLNSFKCVCVLVIFTSVARGHQPSFILNRPIAYMLNKFQSALSRCWFEFVASEWHSATRNHAISSVRPTRSDPCGELRKWIINNSDYIYVTTAVLVATLVTNANTLSLRTCYAVYSATSRLRFASRLLPSIR